MDFRTHMRLDFVRAITGSAAVWVRSLAVDTVVIAILLSVGVLLPAAFYQTVAPFMLADYDYRVSFASADQLADLYGQPFCGAHFAIGPIYDDVVLSRGGKSVTCELQVCDSFENIGISCYCPPMVLESGPGNFVMNEDSIMVSATIADALHLSVGDEVRLDNEASYAVARIYESTEYQAREVALVQFNEHFTIFDNEAVFNIVNNAYVCVSDSDTAQRYFAELASLPASGADDTDVIVSSRSEDSEGHAKDLFGIGVVIVSSIVCMLILFLYLVRTGTNSLSGKRRLFATLHVLGAGPLRLMLIMVARILASVFPALVLAVLLSKQVLVPILTPLLLSWKFLLEFAAMFALTALVSTLVAARRMVLNVTDGCIEIMNAKGM